jgi:hypothetical protein
MSLGLSFGAVDVLHMSMYWILVGGAIIIVLLFYKI